MAKAAVRVIVLLSVLVAAVVGTAVTASAAPTYPAEPKLPGGWIDIEATRTGDGYWALAANGSVQGFGAATDRGGTGALRTSEKAVALSGTPSGADYWVSTSTGRVIARGGARSYGDASALPLNGEIVDSTATPTGLGYYLVAADGGVFAYGDATFYGSMGGQRLNAPVVALAPTPSGKGYWLVASDGGVFSFGDAAFRGSMGGRPLNAPVRGIVAYGAGYLLVASDGGVFVFSDLPFTGSLGGQALTSPVVAAAPRAGGGYWLLSKSGAVTRFGAAEDFGSPIAPSAACANTAFAMRARSTGSESDLLRVNLTTGAYTFVGIVPDPPTAEVTITQSCNIALVSDRGMLFRFRIFDREIHYIGAVEGPTGTVTVDGNFVLNGTSLRRLDDGSSVGLDPGLEADPTLHTVLVDPTARLAVVYSGTSTSQMKADVRDLDTGAIVSQTAETFAGHILDWSPRHDTVLRSVCTDLPRCVNIDNRYGDDLTSRPLTRISYTDDQQRQLGSQARYRGDGGFIYSYALDGLSHIYLWDRTGAFERTINLDFAATIVPTR